MSVTTAVDERRKSSLLSDTWRWVLLLFPVVVAAGLFLLRQVEVNALARRSLPDYGTVPSFQLTNQDGKYFSSSRLAGKIWIADFIFTSCRGPCPIISSRMSELQKPLRDSDVHLVSFTVDPETDTPEVLHGYAERLHAQSGRWDFLTGSKTTLYDISRNGFKLGVAESGDEEGVPVHSTRFVLVDRKGSIRGYYDALAPDGVTKVLADASHLLREQPK
jgi:cytochrome oxidase Cu insertion factor (SCO1/SenC/PrrC family)